VRNNWETVDMDRKPPIQKQRKQITVLLDPREAERFERYCEERGFKKSTLIARLVREHLNSQRFGQPEEPQS
jgi:hypothetical protein